MKRLACVLMAISMLTACSSKEADTEDLQDSIDFELDSKTQVEAPTANTPQYSIEDNEGDSLDDLLGSPQTENVSNETNDVDDILNLLEQTIDPESQDTQEQPQESSQESSQEQPQEPSEPTVSVSVTGTSETPETPSQQPSQQSTPRKVPNTGIYPD